MRRGVLDVAIGVAMLVAIGAAVGTAVGVSVESARAQSPSGPDGVEAGPVATTFAERVGEYASRRRGVDDAPAAPTTVVRAPRQGDIFSPVVTAQFKALFDAAFRGPGGRAMRRTIREGDPARPVALRVNDVYPADIPVATMPPTLLRRLPRLPKGLAYRIVGAALVLQNVDTGVIVDFMPDAVPRPR